MGRIESILGLGGLALAALLLLGALLRLVLGWSKSASSGMDEVETGTGPDVPAARGEILPSFTAVIDRVVRPRHLAHPGWERLDGAHDVPGRTVALFEHAGTVYALNGASRIGALLAAQDWIEAHPGEDALVVRPTKGRIGEMMLRPEIGQPAKSVLIQSE